MTTTPGAAPEQRADAGPLGRTALVTAVLLALVALSVLPPQWELGRDMWWPTLGLSAALLVYLGRRRFPACLVALTVLLAPLLALAYDLSPATAVGATTTVTAPALLAAWLLDPGGRVGALPASTFGSRRFHLVVLGVGLLCALVAYPFVVGTRGSGAALPVCALAFVTAVTALLVVLPLLSAPGRRAAAAGRVELLAQRAALVLVVAAIFWPTTGVGLIFLLFPVLGWGGLRAGQRETHLQVFGTSVAAYVLTLAGHGPLAADLPGNLPPAFSDVTLFLFIASLSYLVVPLAQTVDRLSAVTRQQERSETTVERMLDSATRTVFVATDADGRMTHYNDGARQTLGYAAADVLGRSPAMFHTAAEVARQAAHFATPPDHTAVVMAQVASRERRDWEFVRQDGEVRMISLELNQITAPGGRVLGYIASGEDITERLRAQEALVTALDREHQSVVRLQEVDHVKQELVSNVSHELRTPITSISGYVELLADGSLGDLSPSQRDAVDRIERNTARLGLLVEDLLLLSRAEARQLDLVQDEVDLVGVAGEAVELLDELVRSRDLAVATTLPEAPVTVVGDPVALERVVTNLVSNAVKFTPDGGRVAVCVSAEGGAGAGVPPAAVLEVSDTGMGISEEDQAQLFTRFFRAAEATDSAIQGTGLGLSIVHAIVEQHGGEVAIASQPGAGTTVTVRLPLAAPEAPGRATGPVTSR